MKHPCIHELEELMVGANANQVGANANQVGIKGKWFPARPLPYPSLRCRLKATWLVFTGKADAVTWPGGQ